jgi:hypothetical protein
MTRSAGYDQVTRKGRLVDIERRFGDVQDSRFKSRVPAEKIE